MPALPAASSRRTTTPVRAKPKLQPVNVYGRRTTAKAQPLAVSIVGAAAWFYLRHARS